MPPRLRAGQTDRLWRHTQNPLPREQKAGLGLTKHIIRHENQVVHRLEGAGFGGEGAVNQSYNGKRSCVLGYASSSIMLMTRSRGIHSEPSTLDYYFYLSNLNSTHNPARCEWGNCTDRRVISGSARGSIHPWCHTTATPQAPAPTPPQKLVPVPVAILFLQESCRKFHYASTIWACRKTAQRPALLSPHPSVMQTSAKRPIGAAKFACTRCMHYIATVQFVPSGPLPCGPNDL